MTAEAFGAGGGFGAVGAAAIVSPGIALARGASLGAGASAVMYLVLNFIAPPARVGRDGGDL
jgi:hypothetical protein